MSTVTTSAIEGPLASIPPFIESTLDSYGVYSNYTAAIGPELLDPVLYPSVAPPPDLEPIVPKVLPAPPRPAASVLTEVLQSGRKFDPKDFDFSSLTLPNSHKANRKKKEEQAAAASVAQPNSKL